MVSLFVDSPLVESAVDVDDIAMDGALSLSTHWVFQSQSLISKRLLSFWLKSNWKDFVYCLWLASFMNRRVNV